MGLDILSYQRMPKYMKRQINEHELDVFFRRIGAAVWYIQYLEDALVHYIVIIQLKDNLPIAEEEAHARLSEKRRCFLGNIYKQARELGIIPQDLEARFDRFVEERNWLIHRSRHECGSHLYDNALRSAMFVRISMIEEEAICIQKIIYHELSKFMVSEGYDLQMAEKIAREELRKLVQA